MAEKAAASQVATPEPLKLPTNEKSPNLLRIRHTSAHVMAMAVQRLFPGVQVTIGPWIDNGFYYDFDTGDIRFTEEDLNKIKKVCCGGLCCSAGGALHTRLHTLTDIPCLPPKIQEMERIIKARLPLRREEVTREEARKRIEAINEPYKLEILDSIKVRGFGCMWMDMRVCVRRCQWLVCIGTDRTHPILIAPAPPSPPPQPTTDGAHHHLPHRGRVVGPLRGPARGRDGGSARDRH